MNIFENQTLKLLRNDKLALGFGLNHLRTAGAGLLARACDHDWLFVDAEHGAFSQDQLAQVCIAALPTGATPIVRVMKSSLDEGARALDNGAQGIVVAHVDTPQEAKQAADAFSFPPEGHRSWGGAQALFGYQATGNAETMAKANSEIIITCMIESPEAVANAEAIAATKGIDVLMIGASDLSAEMGVVGKIGHPKMQDAFAKVAAACRQSGKAMGMGGVYDSEWGSRYMTEGVRFVLAGTDHTYLMAGATARSTSLRDMFQKLVATDTTNA